MQIAAVIGLLVVFLGTFMVLVLQSKEVGHAAARASDRQSQMAHALSEDGADSANPH